MIFSSTGVLLIFPLHAPVMVCAVSEVLRRKSSIEVKKAEIVIFTYRRFITKTPGLNTYFALE
jgi:hypothetical protein